MARSDYSQMGLYEEGYNSAGSQFFIVTKDNSNLNGQYAAFGKIMDEDSMVVLDKISEVEVKSSENDSSDSEASTPVNPPVIKSITVDTFGVDYGEPKTVTPFDYTKWFQETYGIDPSAIGGTAQ